MMSFNQLAMTPPYGGCGSILESPHSYAYGQRTMTPKVICEQTRVEYKIFHKHVTVFRESNSSEKVKCLAIFMVKLESLKKDPRTTISV